jgi:membrane-associated phospholipid phosphatase
MVRIYPGRLTAVMSNDFRVDSAGTHLDQIRQTWAARKSLVVLGSCATLVAFSYFVLDRPLADFVRIHLQGLKAFVWLTYISEPLRPLALIALVGISLRVAAGRPLGRFGQCLLLASLALVVALVVTQELKYAFGRTWPNTWVNNNPSYFRDGVFGLNPFHGGAGYASFPSGHMTAIAAVGAVLWHGMPRLGWLTLIAYAIVAIGLIGASYHWLSDIIAGAIVGSVVGVVLCRYLPQALRCKSPFLSTESSCADR